MDYHDFPGANGVEGILQFGFHFVFYSRDQRFAQRSGNFIRKIRPSRSSVIFGFCHFIKGKFH